MVLYFALVYDHHLIRSSMLLVSSGSRTSLGISKLGEQFLLVISRYVQITLFAFSLLYWWHFCPINGFIWCDIFFETGKKRDYRAPFEMKIESVIKMFFGAYLDQ